MSGDVLKDLGEDEECDDMMMSQTFACCSFVMIQIFHIQKLLDSVSTRQVVVLKLDMTCVLGSQ